MDGRVLQVNVSPGGVPKRAVDRAWVGPLGLEGDRHKHDTVHGGPHRAVALLGIEAIGRVQADGHPIAPGSVGENLTTEGIELATLPIGTRLAVGERLLLELSAPANPCDVIGASFRGGKSGRISIITHPTDSRMYARTLVEGEVRPGDSIRVLPPAPDSAAADLALLDRIDAATLDFTVGLWQAVASAGIAITIEDDGELAIASSPELTSSAFNRALGHRMLPQLTDRMRAFYEAAGVPGWIVAGESPWPGAVAEGASITFVAEPSEVPDAEADGLTIREIGASEADAWSSVLVEASDIDGADRHAWIEATRRLVGSGGRHHLIAEREGAPVAVAGLFTRRRVGLLATTAVLPAARGHGIQRALIAQRVRLAAERGCTLVVASANVGSPSAANLESMGFRQLQESALYRCDPVAAAAVE
jgi:MOSC domain-containing protein YiiM/ribosomal protein S18 acetylase RimI-like enzyme